MKNFIFGYDNFNANPRIPFEIKYNVLVFLSNNRIDLHNEKELQMFNEFL